jgi:hypothetical protein
MTLGCTPRCSVDDVELNRSTPDLGVVRIGTGTAVPEFVAGNWYWLRLDATGDGATTTLRSKVWRDGDSEPTAWTVSTTDTTATLQSTGGVGVRVQSSSTAQPANVEVDDYTATSSG